MKVHLIKRRTVIDFVNKHAASKSSFNSWLSVIKYVAWQNPEDMLLTFGSADLLGNGSNRVVFDIGGNNYRMICKYAFGEKEVHLFVCWIGTHAEYTKLLKEGKQYVINKY